MVTLLDEIDDLEHSLAGAPAAPWSTREPSERLRVADEDEDEEDLYGEDDLGFDDVEEDGLEEDELEGDDEVPDEDLDDEL